MGTIDSVAVLDRPSSMSTSNNRGILRAHIVKMFKK